MTPEWGVAICLIVLAMNLLVLALTMKLYTEFAKDRFQSARKQSDDQEGRP
jgi:hypothetical protein